MKKFLVIGNPIEHSLSPQLHNFWIKNNNLNATYTKKKLNDDDLDRLIFEMRENRLNGINVTVPFKKKIIPYLDELTKEAKETESVNTIYLKDGKIKGSAYYNNTRMHRMSTKRKTKKSGCFTIYNNEKSKEHT